MALLGFSSGIAQGFSFCVVKQIQPRFIPLRGEAEDVKTKLCYGQSCLIILAFRLYSLLEAFPCVCSLIPGYLCSLPPLIIHFSPNASLISYINIFFPSLPAAPSISPAINPCQPRVLPFCNDRLRGQKCTLFFHPCIFADAPLYFFRAPSYASFSPAPREGVQVKEDGCR